MFRWEYINTVVTFYAYFWEMFYKFKAIECFFCVYIALSKHEGDWENSQKLCKLSTASWICITVSKSPNLPRVLMRLCKHGKSALLLKCTIRLWWVCRIELVRINWYKSEKIIDKGKFNLHYLIFDLYKSYFLSRVTASTGMNDTSSRSHAIFTINFTQVSIRYFECLNFL